MVVLLLTIEMKNLLLVGQAHTALEIPILPEFILLPHPT
jgi:hypothetical protein